MAFQNNPQFITEDGVTKQRRFQHNPFSFEHQGLQVSIKENGKIIVKTRGTVDKETSEIVYDEIEFPASLVFKLQTFLQATRKVVYEPVEVVEKSES